MKNIKNTVWFIVITIFCSTNNVSYASSDCLGMLVNFESIADGERISMLNLRTSRLELRPPKTVNEIELILEIFGHPEVGKMSGERLNPNFLRSVISQGQTTLKEIKNKQDFYVNFAIFFEENIIGTIQLAALSTNDINENVSRSQETWAGVGYHLLPEYWGQGIASESLKRIIRFAFENLNVDGIKAAVHKDNTASKKVLENTGGQSIDYSDGDWDYFAFKKSR